MKQVLSVADFVVITNLLNERIRHIEDMMCHRYGILKEGDYFETPVPITDKNVQEHLALDNYYQSLIHLKKSLENLPIYN